MEPSMQPGNTRNEATPSDSRPAKMMRNQGSSKGTASGSQEDGNKIPNPKTLRRLVLNREASRKSRLRKKAYIQQLESSRIKLTQLEQELQRDKSQGLVIGGGSRTATEEGFPVGMGSISSDAAQFDINYTKWLEDHRCLMWELRAAARNYPSLLADSLRQQTIHQLPQILTTRQAAGCLIATSEYFNRLRTQLSLGQSTRT